MKSDTPRTARKKLLLLEGTLQRLEILEAKDTLRRGVAGSVIGQHLPGLLSFIFEHRVGALLAGMLPLLVGAGRAARIARRGTLLLGAATALLGWLRRRRPAVHTPAQQAAPAPADPEVVAGTADPDADKKNPGQCRD